jgi:hypothetical protein
MELSGDLSDFALTDILQILALSRKSGTLSLESGDMAGVVVVVGGRITYASFRPGESLAERLLREGKISAEGLSRLRRVGGSGGGVWTLRSLILESGAMSVADLEGLAKRHICEVVGSLVHLEKGRFGIALNQVETIDTLEDIGISDGLDIGEVLLGAAKEIDEYGREAEENEPALPSGAFPGSDDFGRWEGTARDKLLLESRLPGLSSPLTRAMERGGAGRSERASLLCSLLAELRSHSFEAEVSLLIMRYASEVAARGVLFVVKENEISGLGQFGVIKGGGGKSPDEMVRDIHIPIGAKSIFDKVLRNGHPYIGRIPANYWHTELLRRIGGNGMPLSVFALPLVCNDRPIFVFYGDNYPGRTELSGIDELVALVNQASVVLEKIVLERMLEQMRRAN